MAVDAESLSPANLSAARQHVRTLSTREREALLRALLEQYESPQDALTDGPSRSHEKRPSRPRHAASASSISALAASVFDCPSLPEEAEDGSVSPPGAHATLPTALSPPPTHPHLARSVSSPTSTASTTSTSTSWPARSASTSAVATTPSRQSPRQPQPQSLPHARSHSTSHSALRSSFSTSMSKSANRQTADSVALFHYRSKSYTAYTASPEFSTDTQRKDKHVVATATIVDIPAKTPPTATAAAAAEPRPRPSMSSSVASSTDTVFHGGLNIITPANAGILQGPATVENSPRNAANAPTAPKTANTSKASISYWCTSCGDQFSRRSLWADHDVACRSTGRHNGRRKHLRPQRAWACGFCAAFLGSVERYQDHVAGHFERGKGLADWHYVNVIYGLLHQPVVHKAWKHVWAARAAALPAGQRPKATWPSGCKFPTKRLDAFALAKVSDTRDAAATAAATTTTSTDSNGDEIIYIGLKEALESFDAAVESASVVVLHAESLAIFISVPTDEQASSAKDEAGSSSRSGSKSGREKETEKSSGQIPQIDKSSKSSKSLKSLKSSKSNHSSKSSVHRATSTTITAVSKPHAKAPAPAPSQPTSSSKPPAKATPMSPPPAYTPAPLTIVTGRTKDDPLPALPLFATLAASLSPPSANTITTAATTTTTTNTGKQRLSSVKTTALKPLSLFRSRDAEPSSTKQDKERVRKSVKAAALPSSSASAQPKMQPKKQRSRPAMPVLGSSTTVTAGSPPNTTTYRPTYWADRPLPPLVNDNNSYTYNNNNNNNNNNYQGVSASASPSSSPETQARLVAADHYTVAAPSAMPSKTRIESSVDNIDMDRMDRMGTSYVDGFMASINEKRAVR